MSLFLMFTSACELCYESHFVVLECSHGLLISYLAPILQVDEDADATIGYMRSYCTCPESRDNFKLQ